MKNFIIETGIVVRDIMAGALLTGGIIIVIAAWVLLDVRL